MTVSVQVVRNDFAKIATRLRERAPLAVSAAAQAIAAETAATAPFPEIAEAVAVEATSDLEQSVVVGIWWAGFWEYGTRNFAARPFITPAAERARALLGDTIMGAFRP